MGNRRATDRLLAAVVIGGGGIVVAVLTGRPEAAVMAVPWAVLLVLGLASSQRGARDVVVNVSSDRLVVGDEIDVTTTVTGVSGGSLLVTCLPSKAFFPDRAADDTAMNLLHDVVVPGETTVTVPLTALQWGVHDLGHVEVTLTEPYGLFRDMSEADEPRLVRVHPQPARARNLLAPWLVRSVTGTHDSRLAGEGIEYADVRPFTAGDSLRDINWRATARSQDIWVSKRHPSRATDVVLLLDSFVEAGHDVRSVFGLAIEGAMALTESHLGVGDKVGLVELGGTVRWLGPSAGRHQLQRIADNLLSTGLYSHEADRNLALLMARALPPRTFVVALTPLLDDRFVEALFVLGASGHDVAVIECVIPDPAADHRDDALRLTRRFWEAERQVTRDRLAERGIAVATWNQGDHLDLTLIDLVRRRRLAVRGTRH